MAYMHFEVNLPENVTLGVRVTQEDGVTRHPAHFRLRFSSGKEVDFDLNATGKETITTKGGLVITPEGANDTVVDGGTKISFAGDGGGTRPMVP